MRELENRSILIVRPKQAFQEWASGVSPDLNDVSLEECREDCTSYLVPYSEELDEPERTIREYCVEIFEAELFSCCADERKWPNDISYEMFTEWFEVEYNSIVVDLGHDGIILEDE